MSSYVNDLSSYSSIIPTSVFGSLCLIDGLLIYFLLPDTNMNELPDTIEDVEDGFTVVAGKSSGA